MTHQDLLIMALLSGCTSSKGGILVESVDPCSRAESDPAVYPPITDEETVLAALEGYHPDQITWGVTANDSTSAFDITLSRTADAIVSVEYTGGCDMLPPSDIGIVGLHLPMLINVAIGEDDVTAQIEGGVDAFGDDLRSVYFEVPTSGAATLSDAWLTAAEHDADAEIAWPPSAWTVVFAYSLVGARVSVDGSNGNDIGGYWDGYLSDSSGGTATTE